MSLPHLLWLSYKIQLKFSFIFVPRSMTLIWQWNTTTWYTTEVLIEEFGPPRIFSTINFESIHSSLKQKMSNSKNWRNVIHTSLEKYSRSLLVTPNPDITEIGKSADGTIFLPLDQLRDLSPIYTLNGLKYYNNLFHVHSTGIIVENNLNGLTVMKVESFLKLLMTILYLDLFMMHLKMNTTGSWSTLRKNTLLWRLQGRPWHMKSIELVSLHLYAPSLT